MLARLSAKPLQRGRTGAAAAPGARPLAARQAPRGALRVVAYRSELSEMLKQRAERYAEVTANAGTMTGDEVAAALSPIMGNRSVTFLADGVIYKKDRKRDIRQLTDALARQHAAYEHMVYRPVVSAVNEEQGVVFSAVYFVLRNRAPVFNSKQATGRISKGFLVDKLQFDVKTGQLVSSLVTRQMTLEERDALLVDPTAWQPAAAEERDLVSVPDVVAGPNDYKYMTEIITKWAGVWSSSASMDVLPQVLAPTARAYDGYGLSNKPNALLWQSPDQARSIISATHKSYDNRNQLVSFAVSDKHKLAFHHWRANFAEKQDRGGKALQPIEGIGLICFNEHLQIERVYEFDLKPYPNLRTDV